MDVGQSSTRSRSLLASLNSESSARATTGGTLEGGDAPEPATSRRHLQNSRRAPGC